MCTGLFIPHCYDPNSVNLLSLWKIPNGYFARLWRVREVFGLTGIKNRKGRKCGNWNAELDALEKHFIAQEWGLLSFEHIWDSSTVPKLKFLSKWTKRFEIPERLTLYYSFVVLYRLWPYHLQWIFDHLTALLQKLHLHFQSQASLYIVFFYHQHANRTCSQCAPYVVRFYHTILNKFINEDILIYIGEIKIIFNGHRKYQSRWVSGEIGWLTICTTEGLKPNNTNIHHKEY